jgi:alpha-methylacyl-CoA racemase
MLLADLGAQVVRLDRRGGNGWVNPIMDRGRSTVEVDLRTDEGRHTAADAIACADVLVEGFRPGVMERLGLGPEQAMALNPRLVYGRMTGWGQEGPLSRTAGHDINYIALAGVLAAMGRPGEPAAIPLNLVGDFGGGSLFLAFGIVAALLERERSGAGQVIDAAIVDGVASMMTMFSGLLPAAAISVDRRDNILSGAAPFYRCYICRDGGEVAVGSIEPQFYRTLIELIGAPMHLLDERERADLWPEHRRILAEIFMTRSAAEWAAMAALTDACLSPVLELTEVADHPQALARSSHVNIGSVVQPVPAPRFSRTPGRIRPTTPDGLEMINSWRSDPTCGDRESAFASVERKGAAV